jgi:CAAX prenyl protease-like protein
MSDAPSDSIRPNIWGWRGSAWPYVLPFALFSLFLGLETLFPREAVYPIKTLLVGGVAVWAWKKLTPILWEKVAGACGVGLLVFVLWVVLDPWVVERAGEQGGFDAWRWSAAWPWSPAWLIGFRLVGATLVVPVMEELFWRGFLMRYLEREDFQKEPLGRYTPKGFWGTTLAFTLAHGAEWPLALMAGLLFGAWFVWSRSLGSVILAHAVCNLALGLYVIQTGQWRFW